MCGCLLWAPSLGTWPATQACAPTGNWTVYLLVCSPVLNPLSHTSQDWLAFLSAYSRWHALLGILQLWFHLVLVTMYCFLFYIDAPLCHLHSIKLKRFVVILKKGLTLQFQSELWGKTGSEISHLSKAGLDKYNLEEYGFFFPLKPSNLYCWDFYHHRSMEC